MLGPPQQTDLRLCNKCVGVMVNQFSMILILHKPPPQLFFVLPSLWNLKAPPPLLLSGHR